MRIFSEKLPWLASNFELTATNKNLRSPWRYDDAYMHPCLVMPSSRSYCATEISKENNATKNAVNLKQKQWFSLNGFVAQWQGENLWCVNMSVNRALPQEYNG